MTWPLLMGILMTAPTEPAPTRWDLDLTAGPPPDAPRIAPWRTIAMDQTFGGQWLVAGDVDGDGECELVSARNVDEKDVHYTCSVAVQKLDGTLLWTWGDSAIGRRNLHHDVACQLHDWDQDGKLEVIVAGDGFVAEIDGATGRERRRFAIPQDASDCLVFADLTGRGWPQDVIVKTRYTQLWAYSPQGGLLWTQSMPGGAKTAHQPVPLDLDGDGRDELLAGFGVLNADGSLRWLFETGQHPITAGHLDCARVLRPGATPAELRLAMTGCGGNWIAVMDGLGHPQWVLSGEHFESVDIGQLGHGLPGRQLVVDIDHLPDKTHTWVIGEDGTRLGRFYSPAGRHHDLVDWDGDGFDEIVIGDGGAVINGAGQVIAVLDVPARGIVQVGDLDGDGVPEVTHHWLDEIRIFKPAWQPSPDRPAAQAGSGLNYTLY